MDSNLRKLQLAELNILKVVTAFLDKNGIRYYMNYGTMIGAIRHKGFIPWDDDVDICIPRPDYEKLLTIANEMPGTIIFTEYRLGNSLSQILQAVDESVIVKTLPFPGAEQVDSRYAWIDIFPIDGMPSGKIARKIHGERIFFRRFLWGLTVNKVATKTDLVKGSSFRVKRILYQIGIPKLLNRDKRLRSLNKLLLKVPYDTAQFVINSASPYKMKDIVPKKWIDEYVPIPFEDGVFNGPKGYDAFLTHLYGDYMTPPPVGSESRNHHNLVEIVTDEG